MDVKPLEFLLEFDTSINELVGRKYFILGRAKHYSQQPHGLALTPMIVAEVSFMREDLVEYPKIRHITQSLRETLK